MMTREQKRREKRTNLYASLVIAGLILAVGYCWGCAAAATWFIPEPEVVTEYVYVVSEPAMAKEEPAEVWTEEVYPMEYLGECTISHYCPCEKCCGKHDGITATGTQATEGRTVAVDPSVIPYGTEISVYYEDGRIETYTAEDCGGAIKGNRLDVYMDSHEAALVAGMTTGSVYAEG
jgi:3D (Asp-Asp-Asp) domain-containing protein